MAEPLVIRHEGKPTHVVLEWDEWQRLRRLAEDAQDIADAERILRDPATVMVPGDVAKRVLLGEHPVRVWREHRGLSQAALAGAAGMAQPTVARIEGGQRKGTLVQMRRLAEALGVRLDVLAVEVAG
jgi:DNA-binding XRE family transcriptional regulator